MLDCIDKDALTEPGAAKAALDRVAHQLLYIGKPEFAADPRAVVGDRLVAHPHRIGDLADGIAHAEQMDDLRLARRERGVDLRLSGRLLASARDDIRI